MDHLTLAQLLGSYGEFVGSIVLVATLIYLSVQTRQNTRVLQQNSQMHEATMYRANIDGVMNLQAILAQDTNLALIWKRGLADEDLSDIEKTRFEAFLNMWLFDLEAKIYSFDHGVEWVELGGLETLESHIKGQVRYLMRSSIVRDWWREHSDRMFGPVFVAKINELIQE
jgi:hypothetical protein